MGYLTYCSFINGRHIKIIFTNMPSIDIDNYYYVQIFTEPYSGSHRIICFADNPTSAKQKVREWFSKLNMTDEKGKAVDIKEICLYHKNYKRESRTMVKNGNYIV